MIDPPVVQRALKLMAQADAIGLTEESMNRGGKP